MPKNVAFAIVGTGKYYSEFQQLIKENYNINIFAGLSQDGINNLLNESKYFIFPSRNEGYPLSTIEAMFCGVPVIGSNIPQVAEQISQGKNGWTVEFTNEDVTECITLMKFAIELPLAQYLQMQRNALNSGMKDSLSYVCTKIVELYKL